MYHSREHIHSIFSGAHTTHNISQLIHWNAMWGDFPLDSFGGVRTPLWLGVLDLCKGVTTTHRSAVGVYKEPAGMHLKTGILIHNTKAGF